MGKIKKNDKSSAKKKYAGEKLLAIPGISEAIDLVGGHAWVCAVNDSIDAAGDGQFGGKIKQKIINSTTNDLSKLLKNKNVKAFIYGEFDSWLEMIAIVAGPKIAELWNLSESVGERLAVMIYWGKIVPESEESILSPYTLLVNMQGEKEKEVLISHQEEFEKRNCIIVSPSEIQEGHIYLDVTELSHSRFRSSYRLIELCRRYLDIKKKDLQVGAPENINTEKALEVAYWSTLQSPKEIAKKLGFKIYSSDNPSGSYPLLHKYLKIGKELEAKLSELDSFIISYIKNRRVIVS